MLKLFRKIGFRSLYFKLIIVDNSCLSNFHFEYIFKYIDSGLAIENWIYIVLYI